MRGFRVRKIFGIDIRIDWSWLLIFGLISWSLAFSVGQLYPEWSMMAKWGVALAAALLFFTSIAAHELAHSLAARAQGVPVRNITLFMFGGVSNIQREPSSPESEFKIAIVGPLTSFLLGIAFLILGTGRFALANPSAMDTTAIAAQFGPISTIMIWLGSINILIGLFNLTPGFPLDGGRILRSILWHLTEDLKKATRWAASIGQAIAWIIIFAGMAMLFGIRLPVLGTGFINGIWLILIGWFLQSAAIQSYRKIVLRDILEDIPVKRMMYADVPAVSANISIDALIDNYLMRPNDRAFVVIDDEKMVGLVTIDDVRKVSPESRKLKSVRDVMTPSQKMVVVAPEEEAAEAFHRLQAKDVRQLPVVRGDKIIGMLRRKDILRWLQFETFAG